MTGSQAVSVRVSRKFEASAERVFDAWLDPAMIERWMFGPDVRDEEIVWIELDPRVGGTFSFVVKRDGERIDHVGKYLEIERPRRLVFTWGVAQDESTSRVVIDIEPAEEGCKLTLVHDLEPEWADFADSARKSWALMLGKLAEAL